MTPEEFDARFEETMHTLVAAMAENPDIDPDKFYSMTCILENLRFFSPVLYGALKPKQPDGL